MKVGNLVMITADTSWAPPYTPIAVLSSLHGGLDSMSCLTPATPWMLEYWSGLPFPSPEDLPDPGIEPGTPALQANSLPT